LAIARGTAPAQLGRVMETVELLAALRPREAVAAVLLERALLHLGACSGAVFGRGVGDELPEILAATGTEAPSASLWSIVRSVIASGKSWSSADPARIERRLGRVVGAAVPVQRGEEVLGVLFAEPPVGASDVDALDLHLLEGLGCHAAIAFDNASELCRRAERDPLTGLANHGRFWSSLDREVERAQRYGSALSVVLLDLDGFKAYNDTLGHLEGDRALAEVAAVLAASSRGSDTVARYGGEEFGVVLAQTSLAGAVAFARKIVGVIRELRLERESGKFLTVAAGVAELTAMEPDCRSLVRRADAELYRAKAAGGDRVSPGR
jgi:diguanylate cyclase (GGDEF)-like protein